MTVKSELRWVHRLAIDLNTGDCWAVDRSRLRNQSVLYKFSASGKEKLALSGFTDLQAVAVNPFNSRAFVIEGAPAKLIQISPDGRRLSTLSFSGYLVDLAVEYVQEP